MVLEGGQVDKAWDGAKACSATLGELSPAAEKPRALRPELRRACSLPNREFALPLSACSNLSLRVKRQERCHSVHNAAEEPLVVLCVPQYVPALSRSAHSLATRLLKSTAMRRRDT